MIDHPILFSTEMVRAILEGRKTQTRRLMKYTGRKKDYQHDEFPGELQDVPEKWGPCSDVRPASFLNEIIYPGSEEEGDNGCYVDFETKLHKDFFWQACIKCPYGKPGDILYVREAFGITYSSFKLKKSVFYKADDPEIPPRTTFKWKPSIHMPKSAARIFLEIVDIKVERLHDLSEEDAKAEGLEDDNHRCGGFGYYESGGEIQECNCLAFEYPPLIEGFKYLWQSINGNWDKNPWVWVVSFKVISTTGNPKKETECKAVV